MIFAAFFLFAACLQAQSIEPEDFPVRLISRTPIEYPGAAKQAKVEGVVIVDLIVDEMGQVMKTEVVRGDLRLVKAVQKAVKLWRFEPELKNGRPVISRYTLPVTFKIKNK